MNEHFLNEPTLSLAAFYANRMCVQRCVAGGQVEVDAEEFRPFSGGRL